MTDVEQKKLEFLEREVSIKERELEHKEKETKKNNWRSPLVVAIFAAAAGAFGNAIVTYFSSNLDRVAAADEYNRTVELAEVAAERERILEMIKIGDPLQVQSNLEFLIDSGLVEDEGIRDSILAYYAGREPGTGPGASAGIDAAYSAPENNPALLGCGTEVRLVPGNNAVPRSVQTQLASIAAATGRVELSGHQLEWIGSGFLVRPNIVLVARHMIEVISTDGSIPEDIKVTMNFDANIACFNPRRVIVEEILYISDTRDRDFALLRIQSNFDDTVLQVPTQIDVPEGGQPVALVSHPSSDGRRDPNDFRRAFAEIYGVKRIGLGEVLNYSDNRLSYGLFSSGGSTGGPVVDLSTGNVFAMHFAGQAGVGGFGLTLSTILEDEEARAILEP